MLLVVDSTWRTVNVLESARAYQGRLSQEVARGTRTIPEGSVRNYDTMAERDIGYVKRPTAPVP